MNYFKFAFKIVGPIAIQLRDYFSSLYDDIKLAKMPVSIEDYISGMILAWAVSLIFFDIIFSIIFASILPVVSAMITALTVSVLASSFVFSAFYFYPSIKVASRSQKINVSIPYTTIYFATLASGNIPPLEMFRIVGNMKEYGEISKECREIVKNVELLGMNTEQSIMKVSENTPSRRFKELLEGIYYNITSGGDLYQYLREKSEIYVSEYKDILRKYSQELSMMNQVYLTIIIVGSVFFIILSTIMNMISSSLSSVLMQFIVVFIIMPILSIGFVALIRAISPE